MCLDDREGRALEQPPQGVGERVVAADDHACDGRNRRGDHRREARDKDVRPVGRDDHERPLDEILDEVLHAHRRDADVPHLAVELLVRAGDHLRVELRRDLGDRGRLLMHFDIPADEFVDLPLSWCYRHLRPNLVSTACHDMTSRLDFKSLAVVDFRR